MMLNAGTAHATFTIGEHRIKSLGDVAINDFVVHVAS